MSIRRFVGYHGVGYPVQSDVPSLERHLNDLTVAVDRSRSDTYDNLTVANCTAPARAVPGLLPPGIDVSFEEISRYLALNAAVFDERNMTLFVFDRLHGDTLIASSKGNFLASSTGAVGINWTMVTTYRVGCLPGTYENPGYMRMAADSTELLRCRVRAACPGGYFGVGVRSCERGFGGAYCSECRAGYYAAPGGSACASAPGPLSPGTVALIAFYVLVAFAVVGLLFGNVSAADAGGLDEMSRLSRLQNKLRAKWKLCFVSVQIATMTPNLLPKFPDYVAGWYVALVEGLAVFNFAPRFPGGSCAGFGRVTFHDALVATTAGPFALMGCVALWGCRVDGCVRGGRAWGSALKACLLVLYVILPTICSTIIDAFYCTDGLDGGVQYYKADLLLPCRGDRHALATICGGVHRDHLVGPFVPRFYWFEVLELARRLFATSFVKILTYRPALRLLLSLLSALAFLKAQIKAEPFVEAADNVLAETLLWIIILNYLALLCVVCSIVSSDAALSAVLTCLLLLVFGVTVVLVFRDVDRERKAVSELLRRERRERYVVEKNLDEVAFEMLSDDYNATRSQLDSIRARRTKFNCVNDNVDDMTPELAALFRDFFASYYPRRSHCGDFASGNGN
ncbi:hypothetical protein JL721_8875 [Aureococcus anophagefferens]|nr:hypothetical protein JL721_8875 [Aureococcus anophagefferens]